MPRSVPTPVVPTLGGTLVTPTAPDATGDILPPGAVLVVACGATGTTVTGDVIATDNGLPVGDSGGAVAPNTTRVFRVPSKRLAGQPADTAVPGAAGMALVNYSSVATVTRWVLTP